MLTIDLKIKFIDLQTSLSPEILSCDGECSYVQIGRKQIAIHKQWDKLEKEAGEKVTEKDTYKFWEDPEVQKELKRREKAYLEGLAEARRKVEGK